MLPSRDIKDILAAALHKRKCDAERAGKRQREQSDSLTDGSVEAPGPMPEVEAVAAAAEEGLALVRSASATGFKGVAANQSRSRPFGASIFRGGRQELLGSFSGAPEAALCYARALGPEGCATAVPVVLLAVAVPMAEAEAAAEPEATATATTGGSSAAAAGPSG